MTKASAGDRSFPPPCSISEQAQAILALGATLPVTDYSKLTDHESWLRHIAEYDATVGKMVTLLLQGQHQTGMADWEEIGGVPVVRARPATRSIPEGKVFLEFHGGALIYLGGPHVRSFALKMADDIGADVVSVDYRMPPAHPFPAALDDALAVYQALVAEVGAENIIVGGASAGGNIAAALLLKARDAGLTMPAGLVLLSPEVDLTESGDSFQLLAGIDRLGKLMPVNLLYADGAPLEHPYLSPLFGDVSHFPPTFLQAGTRDLFLSNTVRLHRALRKANIDAELHIWEAMPHGGFIGAPEDSEVVDEIRRYLTRRWLE